MKKYTFNILFLIGMLFSLSSFSQESYDDSHNGGQVLMMPGTSKTITIKTFGAATASRVWLTGAAGVTATLRQANATKPNQIDITLTARNTTTGGNGTINLQLLAGVHKNRLKVYYLPNVRIEMLSSLAIAGQRQRIAVEMNNARESNFYVVRRTGSQNYPITRTTTGFYFDVVDNINTNHNVDLTIIETPQKAGYSPTQDVRVSFRKDSTVPDSLGFPPRLYSADRSLQSVTRDGKRSPNLRWYPVNRANEYEIEIKSGSKTITKKTSRTSIVIPDLVEGDYSWKVKARHKPANNSVLSPVETDFTEPFNFKNIKDSTLSDQPSPLQRKKPIYKKVPDLKVRTPIIQNKSSSTTTKSKTRSKQRTSISPNTTCPKGTRLVKGKCVK